MSKQKSRLALRWVILVVAALPACRPSARAPLISLAPHGRPLRVLFLGDRGHHKPAVRFPQLALPLKQRGIVLSYTENMNDLNPNTLRQYDVLMVYANINKIAPAQERAVLDFVAGGGGFAPIHCASGCFKNSAAMIALTGAQFKSHRTGVFRTRIAAPDHPVMKGFAGFKSWDETYVHKKHNETNRTVLSYRVEGDHREPWTWVRTHGQGRVFYTAWGHDHRTWGKAGFHELIRRGLEWAAGDAAAARLRAYTKALAARRAKRVPLRYEPRPTVPNYEKRVPHPQYQFPLAAKDSLDYIELEPGFELKLFASEPDIVKPIAFTWDHRGRLWLVETVDYPNTFAEQGRGHDRIKICEDTNGDGRADRFTVFADGLNIPTGIVLANGGVIVAQAPHFLFFQDTDGDDKADVRKIIMSGWGKSDTHAGPSNLTYGLDNWIYGAVGYSNFRGSVGGKSHSFSRGVYRFRRDLSEMDFITQYSNNTWGLGISETGEIFGSTANGTHHMYTAIPNRYFRRTGILDPSGKRSSGGGAKIDAHYAAYPLTDKIRQVDVRGGYTAAAGQKLYTARAFPKKYWNRATLVCEPTMHLLHQGFLKRDGSGWTEDGDGGNLLAAADEWVAPVYAETGPDGAVWMADWYNFIVQHNPVPKKQGGGYFEAKKGRGNAHANPLRDKTRGRIYRIVWSGAKKQKPPRQSLDPNNASQLVSALTDDNMFWRLTAQRLLVQRGRQDVVPELISLAKDTRVEKIGPSLSLNGTVVHALWTLHGLGALDGSNSAATAAAVAALKHPSAGVRRNAVQVLARNDASANALLDSGILTDRDANVQLAALLAASEMPPSARTGALLYRLSKDKRLAADPWLPKAVKIAVTRHAAGFLLAALDAGETRVLSKDDSGTQKVIGKNLFPNPTFKKGRGGKPTGWRLRNYSGTATREWVKEGRNGGYCVKISSTTGADSSLFATVKVKPDTRYRLSGWIKTRNVRGATGALLNVHELKHKTKALKGTTGWTRVRSTFHSGRRRTFTINLLFGGWGRSTGVAWYDDVELVRVGKAGAPPAGETNDLVALAAMALGLRKNGSERDQSRVLARMANADPGLVVLIQKHLAVKTPKPKTQTKLDTAGADVVITIKTVPGLMQYDIKRFQVKPGQKVALVLENPDQMLHNILICKPGSLARVGAAADAMLADPEAFAKSYIPDSPDVIAASRLVAPGGREVVRFTAPEKVGEYPYVCTFPAHWRIMNGVMVVAP